MNRKILTTLLGVIFSSLCWSQVDLSLNYTLSHPGRNIGIEVSGRVKQYNEFGGGIFVNLPQFGMPSPDAVYRRKLQPVSGLDYLGFDVFYQRYFLTKLPHIQPYVFYNFQYTCSSRKSYTGVSYSTPEITRNLSWIDQSVGVGFSATIFKGLYITQKIGLVVPLIVKNGYKPEDYDKCTFDGLDFMVKVGIGWHF